MDVFDVLKVFLKLGLTSFGGPIAHLGYFRREFVENRRWLDDEAYTDLVALCQFLPGSASSQMGFSIGLMRAGWLGGLAAWCGFTLPSVLLLIGFASVAPDLGNAAGQGLIHGLKLVAVAVVAQAVWDMARRLCAIASSGRSRGADPAGGIWPAHPARRHRQSARCGKDTTRGRQWLVNDLGAKHDLLRGGLCWGHMPHHVVAQDLANGTLVELQRRAWHMRALTFMISQRRGYSFSECETRLVALLGNRHRFSKGAGKRSVSRAGKKA
jgi:chromate transport protein ChrA